MLIVLLLEISAKRACLNIILPVEKDLLKGHHLAVEHE
jgi:hypothetical protein